MNVQVNAVRVGGVLSPLISVLRAVLDPNANATVCVQVQNLLGLDLTFLGVEIDVAAPPFLEFVEARFLGIDLGVEVVLLLPVGVRRVEVLEI